MVAKLTQDTVIELFMAKGFVLLDPYIDSKTSMNCICPSCNTICQKTIGSLRNTTRGGCKNCVGKSVSIAQRLDQLTVEGEFAAKGFEVIADQQYVNQNTPLLCKCPNCGKIHPKTRSSLKQVFKGGCDNCKGQLAGRTNTHSIDYVKQYFKDRDCIFLSDSYVNGHIVYDYLCICGRTAKINFVNFSHGKRCRGCQSDNSKGEKNPFWKPDRERLALDQSIARRARKSLRRILDSMGKKKDALTEEMLGYTIQDLIEHLSNHPNWPIVENTKWHIDHIFPIKAFLDHGIEDPKIINALDNLQPLPALVNARKGHQYDIDDFIFYIAKKGFFYSFL